MKRLTIVLVVVGVLSGFVLGQAAPKLKFPYVSAALNAPCGKTEFEYRCAVNKIDLRADPNKLCVEFDLTQLAAFPTDKGLLVKANATLRPGVKLPMNGRILNGGPVQYAANSVVEIVQVRFGEGRGKSFVDGKDLVVELYLDGKLIATRTLNEFKLAPL